MKERVHSTPSVLSRLAGMALLVSLVGSGGCGDAAEAVQHDTSLVPLVEAGVLGAAADFSGNVPRLRSGTAPADTLRMLREFGSDTTFGFVMRVRVVGNHLIAADRFMSPHLTVFDRHSGQQLSRFGRDGEGPGEFRVPSEMFVVQHDPGVLWLYDFSNRRATRVHLDGHGQPSSPEQISLNVGASIESPAWVGDRILANGIFADYTLLEMGLDGTPLRRIAADVPFRRETQNTIGGRQANRSSMAVSPTRDRLALAYQWTSRVDFYTSSGERYGTVNGPRDVQTGFRIDGNRFRWEDEAEFAYFGADATVEYVFAMFCGCTVVSREELPDRLHVFRWNGDFVAEIALDRPVAAISVSPDGKRLYGAFIDPVPGVGEWELPSSFRRSPAP